ncbi:hypothetical protein L596_019957 [Steinernema carpocapsae]|uniref:COP9 signalosome complex subunit 3 n=1 Tax=Steinernema carpocapsae TaxID=34508 RepID=A0A4U5MS90_STECR|nr:hypothetical protein L596_019957 [Steinernema carpocapsae]
MTSVIRNIMGAINYDEFMNKFANAPTTWKAKNALAEELKNMVEKNYFRGWSFNDFMRGINTLNPETHTMPFLALYYTKIDKDQNSKDHMVLKNLQQTWQVGLQKMKKLNTEDARSAEYFVNRIVVQQLNMVPRMGQMKDLGIKIVKGILTSLMGDEHKITSLHTVFLKICIETDQEEQAVDLIFQDARENIEGFVPSALNDSKNFFFYFVYSGMVHLNLENFSKALHLFLNALMIPISDVISEMHVNVYKKFVLLNYILGTPIQQLPACLNNSLDQVIRQKCSEYEELLKLAKSDHYRKDTAALVMKHVSRKERVFNQDDNLVLALKVVECCRQNMVMRVARTYERISCSDAVTRSFCKTKRDLEELLSILAQKGRVEFEFDEAEDCFRFSLPEREAANAELLERALKSTENIKKAAKDYDNQTRCHKEYVSSSNQEHAAVPSGF